MRKIIILLILTIGCLNAVCASGKKANVDTKVAFMRIEFSENDFYVNQCVGMTILLYSEYPDISYFREVNAPRLEKGELGYITRSKFNSRSRKETFDGKEYWVIPVAQYYVMLKEAGKYTITGGEYDAGLNVPVLYDDPFYGRIRGVDTRNVKLSLEKSSFKVKNLPKVDDAFPFSGAVGEFEVETIIPRGDIIVNEEATAIIVLKGKGLLGDDVLPEYREAFGQNMKLKSFSERNDVFQDSSGIISEKEMECVFIPESREDCEVGVVRFGYFNPKTGKYEVAESSPVKINVESSAIKSKVIDI